ncbi:MAG TPA: hypothetical protein ENI23_17875 [bacterium]|nr:hypothetical protein [bacterium]
MGLDRVDNKKGYELENCVPCCKICNSMKMTMDKDEFLKHIKRIADFKFMQGVVTPDDLE